jgi:hypothetical protein
VKTMWMRAVGAAGMLAGTVTLGACQQAPPPPPKPVCDPITEEQNAAVQVGMTLADVQWLTGKQLTLSSEYRYDLSTGPVVWQTYIWDLDFSVHGCGQYVSYSFENGRLTSKSWMKVIK